MRTRCRQLLGVCFAAGSLLLVLMLFMIRDIPPNLIPEEHIAKEDIWQMLKEAEADNGARLRQVEEVCLKYNLGLYRHSSTPSKLKHPPTPQYSVFYIDKIHKLSWCPIYKAASTTWTYNLCLLSGQYSEQFLATTKEQLSELARKVYPELSYTDAEDAFQTTLKFVVVRHPFERLLSAYRDKLENSVAGREHGTLHYYHRYGRHIVNKYRLGGNATSTDSLINPDQYWWDPGRPKPAGNEPTFQEFVRYLLDIDLTTVDDHWIPYYLYCTPCLLKYDIIAKVETMQRDQVYTIHAAGLQDKLKPRWLHRTALNRVIAQRYFSQLSSTQILKLHSKYQLDFELFGYDPSAYLQYSTNYKGFY